MEMIPMNVLNFGTFWDQKKVKSDKYELCLKLLVSLLPSPPSSARVVPPVLTCSPSEEKGPGLIF